VDWILCRFYSFHHSILLACKL